jgi:flagellar FliL protein
MILTGVSLLTTLAVIGLFYYTEKVYKKPPIDENKERDALFKEKNTKSLPYIYKIDKMTVSLIPIDPNKNQRMRWLEVEVNLELFKEEDLGFVKAYLAAVQDRIIEITSKMGPDEINTVSGKVLLEERLKNEFNRVLKKKVVYKIYFSKFIVQ